MKSPAFAMSDFQAIRFVPCVACLCVLEPLENCASLSLIAFANRKGSGEPVLKRNQSLFCYNLQRTEVLQPNTTLLAQLGS